MKGMETVVAMSHILLFTGRPSIFYNRARCPCLGILRLAKEVRSLSLQ